MERNSGNATTQDIHNVTEQCNCYHCGKPVHLASRCRVDKDVICHKCKKPGHLPEIFQQVIEGLMQGIPGVIVFFDDILISRSTEEEHLKGLDEALSSLEKAGLRVKAEEV